MDSMECDLRVSFTDKVGNLQRHVCRCLRCSAAHHRLPNDVLSCQRDLELRGLVGLERVVRHCIKDPNGIV